MPRTNPPRSRKREAEAQGTTNTRATDISPSRPVRKRRKANTASAAHPKPRAPRTPEFDDTDDDNDDAASTTSAGHAVAQELADYVVPWLNVATDAVNAAEDYSNQKNERTAPSDLQAYAKIAGRAWTYYVKRVSVSIGRHPDALSRPSLDSGTLLNGESLAPESMPVDIDLGPSKHVSRLSASIFYEVEDWRLLVEGRNSLKVNEKVLRRGQQIVLHSGDIIDIANTQMIFVLAQEKAIVHPNILDVMGWRNKIPQRLLTNTYAQRYQDLDKLPHAHPETPSRSGRLAVPNTASSAKQRNGQYIIAPAPPDRLRPTTPDRSPEGIAPLLAAAAASPSPTFHHSRINGAAPIDYSLDEHAAEKPTATYTVLITQAILSTPEHMLTLAGIYKFIQDNYAYFRKHGGNWQNSVRHNLSLAVGFQKVPRRSNEPGKGMKWTLNPDPGEKAKMIAALEKHMNKGGGPASPTAGESTNSTRKPKTDVIIGHNPKLSPTGSPPMSAYPPTAPESYTPTRGPHLFHTYPPELTIPSITRNSAPEQIPTFSEGALPVHHANGSSDNAAPQDSPSSSFPHYTMLSGDQSMFTPAPKRQNPRLAAPSTARLPSSFMFDSSPAPFWKYPGLAGSTPARGIDLSPIKAGPLQSSSPPPIHTNGIESPTRTRRTGEAPKEENEKDVGLGVDAAEEEEEVQIDLTRGFQSIGSFHKQMTAANNATFQSSFS